MFSEQFPLFKVSIKVKCFNGDIIDIFGNANNDILLLYERLLVINYDVHGNDDDENLL